MTPSPRSVEAAEKIARELFVPLSGEPKTPYEINALKNSIPLIAAEIESAIASSVQEASVRRGIEDAKAGRLAPPDEKTAAYLEGFKVGYEEGLEEVEKTINQASLHHTEAPCIECELVGPLIARIRALKEKK